MSSTVFHIGDSGLTIRWTESVPVREGYEVYADREVVREKTFSFADSRALMDHLNAHLLGAMKCASRAEREAVEKEIRELNDKIRKLEARLDP